MGDFINALTNAGGYAILAGLAFWMLHQISEGHREEVAKLGEVIRENTAAISALLEHFRGSDS